MPEHKDFGLQRGPRSKQPDQNAPNQPTKIAHRTQLSPDSPALVSRLGFAVGTPDEPEIIPSSTRPICLTKADGGHTAMRGSVLAWLRYAEEAKVKAAKESLPLALSPSETLMAPLAAWRPLAWPIPLLPQRQPNLRGRIRPRHCRANDGHNLAARMNKRLGPRSASCWQ